MHKKRRLDARTNLSYRFEDWLYKECKIEKQINYNYRDLHKLEIPVDWNIGMNRDLIVEPKFCV